MSHFRDAVELLNKADELAQSGIDSETKDEALVILIGSLGHLLAAQVHATLAVAESINRKPLSM